MSPEVFSTGAIEECGNTPSFLSAPDRVQNESSGGVNSLDVRPWITPSDTQQIAEGSPHDGDAIP